MPIVQKKYDCFTSDDRNWIDLSKLGTTAEEGVELDFGGVIKARGGETIFGTDHALENNGAYKLLIIGSHGIAGTGTVTLTYYTDADDGDVDKKIGESGPLTADDIGGGGWLDLPNGYIRHKLKITAKASAEAGTAFTAGKMYVTLAPQLPA